MANTTDVHIAEALPGVLRPYANRLDVVRDNAAEYYMQTRAKPDR